MSKAGKLHKWKVDILRAIRTNLLQWLFAIDEAAVQHTFIQAYKNLDKIIEEG